MSWDKAGAGRHPCPCGRGEYEWSFWSDDWGQQETRNEMLCPACKELYVYIGRAGGRFSDPPRGWTLKSVLEAEQRHRDDVMAKAKELYFTIWRGKFAGLKTKKQQWDILTRHGRFYPAYGTFCDHTPGKSAEGLTAYIDGYFGYYYLRQVFEVCGVQPTWEMLGVTPAEMLTMRPEPSRSHDAAFMDLTALKKRFEKDPRILWVNRLHPQGAEWTVNLASILQGGQLRLRVVRMNDPTQLTT